MGILGSYGWYGADPSYSILPNTGNCDTMLAGFWLQFGKRKGLNVQLLWDYWELVCHSNVDLCLAMADNAIPLVVCRWLIIIQQRSVERLPYVYCILLFCRRSPVFAPCSLHLVCTANEMISSTISSDSVSHPVWRRPGHSFAPSL